MTAAPRTVAVAEAGQAEEDQAEAHTRAEARTRAEAHTRAEVDTQAAADTSAHPAGARSTAAAGKAHSGSIFGPTVPLDAILAGKDTAHRCST